MSDIKQRSSSSIISNNLPPFSRKKLSDDKPIRKRIDINDPKFKTQRMLMHMVIRLIVLVAALAFIFTAQTILTWLGQYFNEHLAVLFKAVDNAFRRTPS